jgi:hypothetical protein
MGKYRDYAPALFHGNKIYPEDLAGMIGLPHVGDIFYVDPYAGSDTANSGTSQDDALATVAAAYAKCTSGNHDVVIIAPTGGTGRTTEAAAITWAKRFTHLIGSAAPTSANTRAGMSFTLAAATTTPQFSLTENGCIFKNVTFKQAVADSYALVYITGDYNYFEDVHIQGMGNATAGDSANGYDLYLNGAGENVFANCTIGDANVARSAANCNLKVAGGSSMNRFVNCRFQHWADNAGVLHATITGGNVLARFILFDHCLFIGGGANAGATACTVAMNTSNDIGGSILLWDSWLYGSTDWADDFTMVEGLAGGQSTGATCGLAQTVA